jgi:hypothetical protein
MTQNAPSDAALTEPGPGTKAAMAQEDHRVRVWCWTAVILSAVSGAMHVGAGVLYWSIQWLGLHNEETRMVLQGAPCVNIAGTALSVAAALATIKLAVTVHSARKRQSQMERDDLLAQVRQMTGR